MVYISSSSLTSPTRASVLATQTELAKAQQELASGVYADVGLQLGSGSGQLTDISQQQARLAATTASNGLASTRLAGTVNVLTSLQTSATSFLATLSSSPSTGYSTQGLAQTAASNLQALIGGLNTTIGGQAIFGGINTDAAPVASYGSGSATKAAVDSAFSSAFGTAQGSTGAASITADAMTSFLQGPFSTLFSASSFGSTWSKASDTTQTSQIAAGQTASTSVSANQSAFRDLAQAYTMVSEFTGGTLGDAAQQAVVKAASGLVSKALTTLTTLQTTVGATQNAITTANDQNAAQATLLTTQAGDLENVDTYALNTRIASLQTALEASYQVTAALHKLSLVNYFAP